MFIKCLRLPALAAMLLWAIAGASPAAAQGVTTGAISGRVTDAGGQPVGAAQVQARNTSTGFSSGGLTRDDGRFNILGLEVGTYDLTVRRIGFTPATVQGVRVTLSQTTAQDVQLQTQAATLEAVTVTADATTQEFAATRQGAQTVVSDTIIRRLPTLDRQFADFVRLTPQVSEAANGRQSAGGQSNRLTNIQVDGVSVANRFGLGDSPTLGAQVSGRALTLEAVKEYQVLLSPFDVRQGNFTGALVNAVTRSGTNEFTGSIFSYFRNEGMAANDPFIRNNTFQQNQIGFSAGGPIVRDRLHFFVAAETNDERRPASGLYAGQPGATLRVTEAQVDSFANILAGYGIAAGTLEPFTVRNPLWNTFARIDYAISDRHRLVVSNIFNDQTEDDFSRPNATANNPFIPLTGRSFQRQELSNAAKMQLYSNFANGWSNEAIVGYTRTRFKRNPSVVAPQVVVQNVGGPNNAQLVAGTENSTQGNELDEDLLEIQSNLIIPRGAHTFTIGTRNEFYGVRNAFTQNSYGNWTFTSLADLAAGTPTQLSAGGAITGSGQAEFSAGQFGLYVQDFWQPTDRFSLTLGLRADMPVFFDTPPYTAAVEAAFGYRTDELPSGKIQLSPRLGFNWDVTGDRVNQLRGGVGLFQGSPAFVWISNQFSNSGSTFAQITCGPANRSGSAPAFDPRPVAPRACGPLAGFTGANAGLNGQPGSSLDNGTFFGTVNVLADDFRFPQVARASLAFDRQLPWNLIGTLEGLYTMGLNDVFYQNINLAGVQRTDQYGRVLYGTHNASGQSTPTAVSNEFPASGGGVIELSNTDKNYSYSLTAQVRRPFISNWEGSLAYTYQRSYSVADPSSSVAYSNFQFGRVYAGTQEEQRAEPSLFDQPHRVVATATYTVPWRYATDLSFIYSGQSGTAYAFVAGGSGGRGDLNADGSASNDPIYIPRDAANPGEIRFQNATLGGTAYTAAEQATAFQQFIGQDECLNEQRGSIMTRGSCRNPFIHRMDVSITQNIPGPATDRISLRVDVFNFLNLLNDEWGKIRVATSNANLALLQHVNQATNAGGETMPVFTFDPRNLERDTLYPRQQNTFAFWQAQVSLRYSF